MNFFERLKLIERINDHLFFEQWGLRYKMSSGLPGSLDQYKEIRPPKNYFWADPHVIFWQEKYYIFYEEFVYKTGKAHISVIVMDEQENCSQPEVVLDKPYHLSYPFIFGYEGDMYMIPESCENHTIELYKAARFPFDWEFQMNIMDDVVAVDTTLYFKDDKWWLFTNMAEEEGEGTWRELYLFSSDSPFSDNWRPHPQNPIVIGVDNSRPAGVLFEHEGKLYRPSQDSAERYGYGLNINEILQMDENVYEEKTVERIKPEWRPNLVGVHTYSQANNLSVVDVQQRLSRWL